ncbi:fibroblast growth factor 18-like [Protopterus annectens]|uniref:fibroblast growth factor 18-like n=1 Tax=Protopterus annectens TaxID=7888 RepID=UPI001CF9E27E|nr:fibroblast growth factor 18-like [Protopterus annectens]
MLSDYPEVGSGTKENTWVFLVTWRYSLVTLHYLSVPFGFTAEKRGESTRMHSMPPKCIYLCLQFLVFCFQVKESHQAAADFRIYVENYTRNPDDMSRKQVRVYQLYSRTTGKHVQIMGKKINANGEDGGKYALLVVETDTFGSHVRIKGKETGHYICMNKKGKIVGKTNGRSRECVFIEEVLENNYTALVSARFRGWYLGFTRKGRPRKGPTTQQFQREVHFMKRYPKGKEDVHKPFKFTTVTRRSRRAKRLKTKSKLSATKLSHNP